MTPAETHNRSFASAARLFPMSDLNQPPARRPPLAGGGIEITCPACQGPVAADAINLDQSFAKCGGCHRVFGIADQLARLKSPVEKLPARPRPKVALPRDIQLEDRGSELVYRRRWFHWTAIPAFLFALLWNAIVGVVALVAWRLEVPDMFILVPAGLAVVGLGLLYYAVCQFFNSTVMRVNAHEITVRQGPLPSPGNRRVETATIEQFYCTERVWMSNSSVSHTTHRYYRYSLWAMTGNSCSVCLLSGVRSAEHAVFLEQLLESRLKIQDKPVAGELPR